MSSAVVRSALRGSGHGGAGATPAPEVAGGPADSTAGRAGRLAHGQRARDTPSRCARCDGVLDVDEPIVVAVREQIAGRSSLAVLGELGSGEVSLVHERCFESGEAAV